MFRKTILFSLILLVAGCGNTLKEDAEAGKTLPLVEEAEKTLGAKEYDKAIEKFKEVLAIVEKSPQKDPGLLFRIRFGLGKSFYFSRSFNRLYYAKESMQEAVALKQNHGEALFYLGCIFQDLGENAADPFINKQALSCFQKALNESPDSIKILLKLGIAYDRVGQYSEGLEALQKAKKLDPQNLEVRRHLGAALCLNEMYAEAEGEYLAILEIKPDYAMVHRSLGWLYLNAEDERFKKTDEAIRYGEQALALEPQFIPSYELLAEAYYAKGDYQKALELVEDAIKLKPENMAKYLQMRANLMAKIEKEKPKEIPGNGGENE